MKLKERKLIELLRCNRELKVDKHERYVRFLHALLRANPSSIPHSSRFLGLLRSKNWELLLKEADSLSSQKYDDAAMHFAANQFSLLVRKYPWAPELVNTNPELEAIKTFRKSERKCSRMNRKFRLLSRGARPDRSHDHVCRSFIKYVLGDRVNRREWFQSCGFGSGASLGVHGNATHIGRKISVKWTVSPGASVYSFVALLHNPHLAEKLCEARSGVFCYDLDLARKSYLENIEYADYNKIEFVPKTAKTERSIAVEPLLNGFLQKGIDQMIRNRLKRVGIDLSDQTLNQRMARQGSADWEGDDPFCTIDLSSASDSMSRGLIRHLLPEDWHDVLNDIRSHSYKLLGDRKVYEKFCSMGNGFCFPLETLVFVAICHAAGCGRPGTDYSVYGDDIIVRRSKFQRVISLLRDFGFTPNTKKTFSEGPFRESCGADWYGGRDVRPFTLDFELDSVQNLFKVLNLTTKTPLHEAFFLESRRFLWREIPKVVRFVRPFTGNPDSAITLLDSDPESWSRSVRFDRKRRVWSWFEISSTPSLDWKAMLGGSHTSYEMYAALSGARSDERSGKPQLPFRRKTRTSVHKQVGAGATSMWLPEPRYMIVPGFVCKPFAGEG